MNSSPYHRQDNSSSHAKLSELIRRAVDEATVPTTLLENPAQFTAKCLAAVRAAEMASRRRRRLWLIFGGVVVVLIASAIGVWHFARERNYVQQETTTSPTREAETLPSESDASVFELIPQSMDPTLSPDGGGRAKVFHVKVHCRAAQNQGMLFRVDKTGVKFLTECDRSVNGDIRGEVTVRFAGSQDRQFLMLVLAEKDERTSQIVRSLGAFSPEEQLEQIETAGSAAEARTAVHRTIFDLLIRQHCAITPKDILIEEVSIITEPEKKR